MSATNDRLATTLLKPLDRGGILWFLFVGFLVASASPQRRTD